MKILLIRPRPHKETIGLQSVMVCEPLELEYLCAALEKEGHETVIVDMILERKPVSYFINLYKPDMVGITSYIAHVNIVKQYALDIKSIDDETIVFAGGVHAEVLPSDFLSDHIDYIVCANGIKTVVELAKELVSNKDKEMLAKQIKGIFHLEKKNYDKETSFPYLHPERTRVSRYKSRYYYMFHRPCALIKTSFGCPFTCNFCFCREITNHKYYVRDIEDVICEIETIKENEIYIVDDNFLVDRERVLRFCKLLNERNLNKKFLIYGRADFIAANEDVIKCFASHGLRAVIVGLESCTGDELDTYDKKTTVSINEKAVKVLNKYGIECYGTFILGIDWTENEFDQLYKWIKKLDLCFINLQPFTPMPGTVLFKEYEGRLIVPRNEFEKWDMAHLVVKPTNMSRRKYYYNIIKLYGRVTLSLKNIKKMIINYGFFEALRLLPGAMAITIQYYKKIIWAED